MKRGEKPPSGFILSPRFKSKHKKQREFNLSEYLQELLYSNGHESNFLSTDMPDVDAVIISTAVLDAMLQMALLCYTERMPSKANLASVFEYPGPLSSLASKIDLAFLFGRIDENVRNDLNIIRSIRNAFCHSQVPKTFDDQYIAEKCKNLKLGNPEKADEIEVLQKTYSSEARRLYTHSAFSCILIIAVFIQRKIAEKKIVDANKSTIDVEMIEYANMIIGRLKKTDKGAAE